MGLQEQGSLLQASPPNSESLVHRLSIPTTQSNETHDWDDFQSWDGGTYLDREADFNSFEW